MYVELDPAANCGTHGLHGLHLSLYLRSPLYSVLFCVPFICACVHVRRAGGERTVLASSMHNF